MAGKRPTRPNKPSKGSVPVVGFILAGAGAGLALVAGCIAIYFILRPRPETPPAPPIAEVVDPAPLPKPPPPPRAEAWWDRVPESNLAGTVGFLKQALPKEQKLFDKLGSKQEAVREEAYQKLLVALPQMQRDPKTRLLVENLVIHCYAGEPADKNAAQLSEWFIKQIPKENVAFPPKYKKEDLDFSFWALKLSIDTLTNKNLPPARVAMLSKVLSQAIGSEITPVGAPAAEIQVKTEKLLALRCYRNLTPTAVRSLRESLAIREILLSKSADILSPASRLKVDVELVFNGLPEAKTAWPEYGPLVQDCLASKDMATDLAIVGMFAKADPELVKMMEPVMKTRWSDVFMDTKLDQKGRVLAIRKVLGVPEPVDRYTQLDKLTKVTLAAANSPASKPLALLQETVRLSHASTLACALLKKGPALERFDQLVDLVPEIDQPAAVAKDDEKKKPDNEPKQPAADPMVGVGKPLALNGFLRPGVQSNVHVVSLKRGRSYFILMVSTNFDTYLRLLNPGGVQIAQDDDSGGNLNALIRITIPMDGNYRIIATSFGGRGVGPYTISITENNAFVGAPIGFAPNPFAPPPFRPPFGRFPPRRFPGPIGMFPPPPVIGIPQQPKENDPDKAKPATENTSQVDEADLKTIESTVAKTRAKGFITVTSKLKGSLAEKDLTLRQAQRIAKFLVGITDTGDLDKVTAEMEPFTKSRNMMLAMADAVGQDAAKKEAGEAVVGALVDQPLLFSNEAWRPACRKLLLLQALELSGKSTGGADDAAEFLRDLYQEQGVLLGMDVKAFEKLTKPSYTMETVIKHMTSILSKENPAKEQKDYLDQVPRQLQAAHFVARNDLERTVLLQRIWIKVLTIYLERQSPDRAKELRQIPDELTATDRDLTNILEQLRGGEEKILRLWTLAIERKE